MGLKSVRRKRRNKLLAAAFGFLVAGAVWLGAEGLLRIENSGNPSKEWFWDASLLITTPIFRPQRTENGILMGTDPAWSRVDVNPQQFPLEKSKNALRIFCVGGSTTAGWPFHARAGYPQWLALMLKDVLPKTKIEVINAGIHGFDTTRELGVVREIGRYHPDIIIFHDGYNDYGDYGLRIYGTPLKRLLLRIHAGLVMNSRVYNLLLIRAGKRPETSLSRSDMRLDDASIRALLNTYHLNLREFLHDTRTFGARPILITLPFSKRYLGEEHPFTKVVWPQMDQMVRQIATEQNVPLIDIDSMNDRPEKFVDSVHCTMDGYRYIAHRALQTLCDGRNAAEKCDWSRLRADSNYDRDLGVDDPEFIAHYSVKLGLFYWLQKDAVKASDYLAQAERASPSPALVFREMEGLKDDKLFAFMAGINRKLGYPERAARFEGIFALKN